uniref:Protein kinase domain-containing protein n=1 Tax=Oryza glaberrima TaxID=4538 RepID=A0A679BBR5_ORYGL|nr:hypothetical protein [Oryza glaberrima]
MAKPLRSIVLVCGDGPNLCAKIAHFGATDLVGELPETETDQGTRGYMAPELIASGAPSRRSDVYVLGGGGGLVAEGGGETMWWWVDWRLRDSFPVDAVEAMTTLALRCMAKDAVARPEMSWVAAKVSKLFLESQDWAD